MNPLSSPLKAEIPAGQKKGQFLVVRTAGVEVAKQEEIKHAEQQKRGFQQFIFFFFFFKHTIFVPEKPG